MRGLSLLALVVGVLIIGYLSQRDIESTTRAPSGEPTTEYVEQKVKNILQDYQDKLDKQAREQ